MRPPPGLNHRRSLLAGDQARGPHPDHSYRLPAGSGFSIRIAGGLLACCALLFAGCVTTPGQKSAPAVPATGAQPAVEVPPAHVVGHEETSTMLDNFTVHVAAVDGVPAAGGREGWNTPVSLKPGLRRLTLVFTRGVFTAQAQVSFVAASGASYRAQFATDAQLFGRNSYCDFWLVDTATNEPVTTRQRVPLTRSEAAPAN